MCVCVQLTCKTATLTRVRGVALSASCTSSSSDSTMARWLSPRPSFRTLLTASTCQVKSSHVSIAVAATFVLKNRHTFRPRLLLPLCGLAWRKAIRMSHDALVQQGRRQCARARDLPVQSPSLGCAAAGAAAREPRLAGDSWPHSQEQRGARETQADAGLAPAGTCAYVCACMHPMLHAHTLKLNTTNSPQVRLCGVRMAIGRTHTFPNSAVFVMACAWRWHVLGVRMTALISSRTCIMHHASFIIHHAPLPRVSIATLPAPSTPTHYVYIHTHSKSKKVKPKKRNCTACTTGMWLWM